MKTNRIAALTASVALAATLAACAGMDGMMGGGSVASASMGMSGRPDADMQAVLDAHAALGARPIETLSVAQARTQPTPADAVRRVKEMRGMSTAPDPTVSVQNLTYPAGAGSQPVRIYRPAGAVGTNLPVVVYYHGGGWVIADLDVYDATPRSMARNMNAIVVSVEYRKGPEMRVPAAHDDANAAWRWVMANAASWGGDPMNMAVAGESAGGNLAMNVAIAARDNGWTQPKAILAVYPIANASTTLRSKVENTMSLPLRTTTLDWFGRYALPSADFAQDPRFNLVAADLRGLPPVIIVNADIDPLRDDGATLETALEAAGVSVERRNWEGATHEFFSMADVVRDAYDAQQWSFQRLRGALR
ncbi:alpha/beta hydrolase [Brevundimonas sp. TWP2-3-2]|uniref:alpha/beta hydrolase n=1 Tax=unclassified Brevundimonas TaxID=2622653 RepID=UPI003CF102F7